MQHALSLSRLPLSSELQTRHGDACGVSSCSTVVRLLRTRVELRTPNSGRTKWRRVGMKLQHRWSTCPLHDPLANQTQFRHHKHTFSSFSFLVLTRLAATRGGGAAALAGDSTAQGKAAPTSAATAGEQMLFNACSCTYLTLILLHNSRDRCCTCHKQLAPLHARPHRPLKLPFFVLWIWFLRSA